MFDLGRLVGVHTRLLGCKAPRDLIHVADTIWMILNAGFSFNTEFISGFADNLIHDEAHRTFFFSLFQYSNVESIPNPFAVGPRKILA